MNRNAEKKLTCPFSYELDIKDAYKNPEVSMFLHCHLRAYDKDGEGKFKNYEYYDKYGAPMSQQGSWEEGYHAVEKKTALFWAKVKELKLDVPLIAGIGGGAHLYKKYHKTKPWNITGWIPQQKLWLSQGKFFSNRCFLGLRGNEIQNDLWDYDPHDEDETEEKDPHDEYVQLQPNDAYKGGYWYNSNSGINSFGRYLHIIALKSHEVDEGTKKCHRYNYIVHPLAYRAAIDKVPDNSVDAMQWCIINMPEEGHFGPEKDWGDKCHGLEIFNDFTYFYSYQAIEGGPHNGELATDKNEDDKYYYYFDTYPLEYGEFLLDSALARGVYYHTMAANDAFYERNEPETAHSEPKTQLYDNKQKDRTGNDPSADVKTIAPTDLIPYETNEEEKKRKEFFELLPYKERTVFGLANLLDPQKKIKEAVFKEDSGHKVEYMGLEAGEKLALNYLINGQYYSSTGINNLFAYPNMKETKQDKQDKIQKVPYTILNQPNQDKLCYEFVDKTELQFTFLPVTDANKDLVWRYTMMLKRQNELETIHGYFKLHHEKETTLNLYEKDVVEKSDVMWLYFTAIRPKNPQMRAWFHAIKGPAFKEFNQAELPRLTHRVVQIVGMGKEVKTHETIQPSSVCTLKKDDPVPTKKEYYELDFKLGKATTKNDICVYYMQVCPHQQDFENKKIEELIGESNRKRIPERILQSVHGYVNLRTDHPTRIHLGRQWDKTTVLDNKVYFYIIDGETGKARAFSDGEDKPKLFKKKKTAQTTDTSS